MKIIHAIYFIMLLTGFCALAFGDTFMPEEIAWSIGFILMMFAVYKISGSWGSGQKEEE